MNIGVLASPNQTAVYAPLSRLLSWISFNKSRVSLQRSLATKIQAGHKSKVRSVDYEHEILDEADILLAIGGDGTMLRAANLVLDRKVPILGVNCGRLGFLADIQQEQLEDALQALYDKSYLIDHRFMLSARLPDGSEKFALNELLFARGATASMVTLIAEYDGKLVNKYWADGLIVSTPTGSTAYNLSSGGPIVMPETNVVVLTPINPHTLTTRPLVVPADRKITIKVEPPDQDTLFSNDGREYRIDHSHKEFTIKRTDFTINLIKLRSHNYFQTLRTKLMWGMDFREKP